jgi:hypothetical protein
MFQTKVVENIKTHFMFINYFFRKSFRLGDNALKLINVWVFFAMCLCVFFLVLCMGDFVRCGCFCKVWIFLSGVDVSVRCECFCKVWMFL